MNRLSDIYERAFAKFATREAVVCGCARQTYAELGDKVRALAEALRPRGVKKGSKIALLYPSEPEFVVAFLALQQLGAVACPLNVESTKSELVQLLDVIDPDAVLVSDQAPQCRNTIEKAWPGAMATTAEVAQHDIGFVVSPRSIEAVLDEVAVILCTSGTTGLPKAAMLTHDNIVLNLAAFREHLESFPGRAWVDREVFGNPIPLSHPYGLIMMTLMPLYLGGATVQIPRFSPAACLKVVEDERVTFFGGVPSMYAMLNRLRRKSDYDATSCRLWISGGAPLPQPVADEFAGHFGTHICEGFGMLETSSLASLNFETPLRHPGSVGPFHAHMRAEIRNEAGRVLPTNETGELWVSGPNIMKGYYRNPAATAEVLQNGWLKTGDLGYFDDDGHCYLKGRSKELVIVGGHNVYPAEVETVLLELAHVADAAVAAENDPVRGERLLAFVVPANGGDIDAQQVLQHCRAHLSPYKVPRAVQVVNSIPRNAAGKIVRRELIDGLKASVSSEKTSHVGV